MIRRIYNSNAFIYACAGAIYLCMAWVIVHHVHITL